VAPVTKGKNQLLVVYGPSPLTSISALSLLVEEILKKSSHRVLMYRMSFMLCILASAELLGINLKLIHCLFATLLHVRRRALRFLTKRCSDGSSQ
jgi:hypothetical protein